MVAKGELCANVALTEGCEGGLYIGCYACLGETHPFVELGVAWDVQYLRCCQTDDTVEDPQCEMVAAQDQRQVTVLIRAAHLSLEARAQAMLPIPDAEDFNMAVFGYDFYEILPR